MAPSLEVPDGDCSDKLASPGVKALAQLYTTCAPRLEGSRRDTPAHLCRAPLPATTPKPGTHSLPEAEPSLFQGQGPGDHSQNPWGSSQGSGCRRKQLSTKLPAPELRPRPPGDASPYPLAFHQMTPGARPSITHVPSVHTPGCGCQLHTSPNPLWGSLPPASHTPCASAAIKGVLVRGPLWPTGDPKSRLGQCSSCPLVTGWLWLQWCVS